MSTIPTEVFSARIQSLLFLPPQRRYLRVLQHTLPEQPVGQDRSKSLPQVVRSVTGAPPPDTFLPRSNSWSWCMAPCPTELPRVSHPITLIFRLAFDAAFACPSGLRTHTHTLHALRTGHGQMGRPRTSERFWWGPSHSSQFDSRRRLFGSKR